MRLGHRYYDASTGRFISRDPIQDGYNWYAYCDNDPVNNVDPTGQGYPKWLLNWLIALGLIQAPFTDTKQPTPPPSPPVQGQPHDNTDKKGGGDKGKGGSGGSGGGGGGGGGGEGGGGVGDDIIKYMIGRAIGVFCPIWIIPQDPTRKDA